MQLFLRQAIKKGCMIRASKQQSMEWNGEQLI
jgi:hypothetical protein